MRETIRREWALLMLIGLSCGCGSGNSAGEPADTADTATVSDQETASATGTDTLTVSSDTADSDSRIDTVPDTACIPRCSGKMCGDDGCGGSCGTCAENGNCNGGVCDATCQPGCTTVTDCAQGCYDLGDCTGTADMALHANVETIGVYLPWMSQDTSLFYREAGAAMWQKGHSCSLLPNGTMAGSIFYLKPDTEYEVMLSRNLACASVRTLPITPVHTTSNTLYVSTTTRQGADCSAGNPCSTISRALSMATPGTDIHVGAGVYHEQVDITASGAEGQYIRIIGEEGAILDGTSPLARTRQWTQVSPGIYSTPWDGNPSYLTRDGIRQYHFITMAGLEAGLGDDDFPIDEGWFVENGMLVVRSADAPSGHLYEISDLVAGFALNGASWIWIEGFEIRYFGESEYPKGIDIRGSDHVVVLNNRIHGTASPLWVRVGANDVRIENNVIYQTAVHTWPWAAVKGTDHENTAINLAGGEGAIVAGNQIFNIFNGIGSGSFDDDINPDIAFDVDVYNNRLRNVNDDGLEPEGACINNRFRNNMVDTVHNGVSLAPITFGPTWVIGNRFTDYDESGFKVSNDSSGEVLLYHNTCFTDRPEQNGMNVSGYFENMTFYNNIIRGTKYAVEMSQTVGLNQVDYNNFFTTRTDGPAIKWNDVRYDTVVDWCSETGMQCHGTGGDPGITGNNAFALTARSTNIDAGIAIPGINDNFSGSAPDIGFLEFGRTEIPPLEISK